MTDQPARPRKPRPYIVEIAAQHANGLQEARGAQRFLVRALSAAAAKRLVEPEVTARTASKDDLVEAIRLGYVLIEDGDASTVGQQVLTFGATDSSEPPMPAADPPGSEQPPVSRQPEF